MPVSIVGKYDRVSEEGYEAFLKALDVNMLLRKAAMASSPTLVVTESGGKWNFKTSTTLKSMELSFELGKPTDESTTDGRQVTTVVTRDGDKFISVQTAKKAGQKSTKTTREFFDDKVVQTMEVVGTDVVCKQVFKRV